MRRWPRRNQPQRCHVGLRPGLVDEHQPARIDPVLMGLPALPAARYLRTVLLAGADGFFMRQLLALKPVPYRHMADTPALIGQLCGQRTRGHMRFSCNPLKQPFLEFDQRPRLAAPLGLVAMLPVFRCRCRHRTTVDTPTPNVAAAARQLCPASTAATTRSRRSRE
jgi:hypothetical protein